MACYTLDVTCPTTLQPQCIFQDNALMLTLPAPPCPGPLPTPQVPFFTFDILTDEAIRQGVKEFGAWPTYPQLYVKGDLVGGCDIITEMQVREGCWVCAG